MSDSPTTPNINPNPVPGSTANEEPNTSLNVGEGAVPPAPEPPTYPGGGAVPPQTPYGQPQYNAAGAPAYGQTAYGQPYPGYAGQQPYGASGYGPAYGAGAPPYSPAYGAYSNANQYNGLAIAGFVCSFLFSIVGLVLSIIGLNQIKKQGGKGRGLAIAGIVISIINTVLGIIITIAIIGGSMYAVNEMVNEMDRGGQYDYSYSWDDDTDDMYTNLTNGLDALPEHVVVG
ncbi:DUF4190 domain-containing protein [Bifidobacterium olomucense]|uniref:DUF4190 domain-containing protein n=1 Tax=Bifidobacterium olomucense TaxID=2675324 RepID=A0A7Y0EXW9_9BIFI|nr:DUF4190 domain-containing protein [Bifidobacterium sp. DSM 109959]NMM98440.1 hypothetical protein [Bifidobacterium sp. DSM 109959]